MTPVLRGITPSVRENCKLGKAVLVGQRVVVENGVEIGDYTKIQTGPILLLLPNRGKSVCRSYGDHNQ